MGPVKGLITASFWKYPKGPRALFDALLLNLNSKQSIYKINNMKTLLLITSFLLIAESHLAAQENPTIVVPEGTTMTLGGVDTNGTFEPNQILCSPNKDTLFMVKGPTTDMILEVWDQPHYKDEKPVFIYVSNERIAKMASMPRYARKSY